MDHMDTLYPSYSFATHKGLLHPQASAAAGRAWALSLAPAQLRPGAPRAEGRDLSQFVHLRLHTEYSLVDGIVRVPELMAAVAAAGMPAVALTDQSNLFAMVKFYKEALAAGVKPLIGVDAWIREAGERAAPSRAVFLCQNLLGYRHLTQLVTRSYLEGQQRGAPMLERAWLNAEVLSGLIVLVGRRGGGISGRPSPAAATRRPCAASSDGRSCAAIASISRFSEPPRRGGGPCRGGAGPGAGARRGGAGDQ